MSLSPTLQNLLRQTGILPSAFLRRFELSPVGTRPTPPPQEIIKNVPSGTFFTTGGVARLYGEHHTTKYRDYQGIFVISAHARHQQFNHWLYRIAKFRNFAQKYSNIHNRELFSQNRDFIPHYQAISQQGISDPKTQKTTGNYITNLDLICTYGPWCGRLQSVHYLPPMPPIISWSFLVIYRSTTGHDSCLFRH